MPATALTANYDISALLIDQDLVDKYLLRVDRFADNVRDLGNTLKSMLSRSEPEKPVMETPLYQEVSSYQAEPAYKEQPTYQEMAAPEPSQNVITANEIDLDKLLEGVNLDGMEL